MNNITFINLQYGDTRSEVKALSQKSHIDMITDKSINPLKDLDSFAAQIQACDLIISIDNSTIHLAGALGKPVWTLLSYVPDWRWMTARNDSPWYPSMQLFRQKKPDDWTSVIEKVKKALTKLTTNRP